MADSTTQTHTGNNRDTVLKQPTSVTNTNDYPVESIDPTAPGAPGNGPVTIRTLQNTRDECEFAAKITVEGFRDKYVHATSEGSLENVILALTLDYQEQNEIFFQRRFVAECNGERAGLLILGFHGDPEPISVDDHYATLGCTDKCGLSCLSEGLDKEEAPPGKCYINHICVSGNFRGKGIGKVLMERADYEAKKMDCKAVYLYVHTRNRAINLYERQGFEVNYRTGCWCCCIWCMMGIMEVARMEKAL